MSTDTITSKLTDTERIATALLGWERRTHSWAHEEHRWYSKDGLDVGINHEDRSMGIHFGKWPDFTTLDGCRLFEDALVKKKLLGSYRLALLCAYDVNESHHAMSWACWVMLRSMPTQRVAACLKVLDEAKL